MKRFLALMFSVMFFQASVQAKEFKSIFGFSGTVGDNAIIVTKEKIKENAGLINSAMEKKFSSADASVRNTIKSNLESGNMELIFCPPNAKPEFNDNINITKSPGTLPDVAGIGVENARKSFEAEISKAIGRKISIQKLESTSLMGKKSLKYEMRGVSPNLISLQHLIQWAPNFYIVITFSFMSSESGDDLKKDEFQKFISSLRETK